MGRKESNQTNKSTYSHTTAPPLTQTCFCKYNARGNVYMDLRDMASPNLHIYPYHSGYKMYLLTGILALTKFDCGISSGSALFANTKETI